MKSKNSVVMEECKSWVFPTAPGIGKNAAVGFVAGVLFGIFGAGIYLRSLVDCLICYILCAAVMACTPDLVSGPFAWLASGCYVWSRVKFDHWRFERSSSPDIFAPPAVKGSSQADLFAGAPVEPAIA